MENFFNLASTRRSIRKFENKDIPQSDIQYFIDAAITAPSGCNSQCWRFVAIKDRCTINKIEEAVIGKTEEILKIKGNNLSEEYLISKKKMVSFFTKAPVVIAVFMTETKFYDATFISALKENGYTDKGIMDVFANYDLLSVGAAIQNMLLAIHEKGYGACWMNEPAIAGEEINRILGEPLEHKFVSLVPVGIPAYTPRSKQLKDISEVFSIIE